jgi:hypothetical protein
MQSSDPKPVIRHSTPLRVALLSRVQCSMTNNNGFCTGLSDLLARIHLHSSGLQAIITLSLFYTLSVHRCTLTRILCLHYSYPGNGFTTISLSFQHTHDIFLVESNSFLAISCSCQFRRFDPILFRLLFCTACELPIPTL